ncbi:hypothetical protein ACET3Z_015715 [Daucus carota]
MKDGYVVAIVVDLRYTHALRPNFEASSLCISVEDIILRAPCDIIENAGARCSNMVTRGKDGSMVILGAVGSGGCGGDVGGTGGGDNGDCGDGGGCGGGCGD